MQERFGEADTPTTQDVKDRWMHAGYAYTHAQKEAEFDRWLAARDRENRAIGWDEGYMRGQYPWKWKRENDDVDPIPAYMGPPPSGSNANPYRGDTT